ncbi:hypothetical protein [Nocardioides speluncae]|uniref:hypothetical protein n=1 Tax=Nocardioides speluncae TaxID=2670337 RepID=UPI000D68B7AB|nr:hypothetical protein [Nocardioides speluncae]
MGRVPLVGLALVAVAAITGCEQEAADEPHRVAAGEMIEGSGVPSELGDRPVVMLPSGKVTFTVTDPIRKLDITDTRLTEEVEPDRGVDLVGVSWERERFVYVRDAGEAMAGGVQADKSEPVGLSLAADGKTYRFPDVGTMDGLDGSSFFHVGIPRAASKVTLEVEYDGLVQAVDLRTGAVDKGAAAPLYRAELAAGAEPDETAVSCPSVDRDRGRLRWYLSCQVARAVAVPYVPGHGWVGDGRTFIVAWTHTSPGSIHWIIDDNRYASYAAKQLRLRTTLDDITPVATLDAEQMSSSEDWLVFDVPVADAHRMRFAGEFVATPTKAQGTGGQHPRRLTLDVEESVRLTDPTF